MGIYYFAVDYSNKLQMWSPKPYAIKAPWVYEPGHPLPCMIMMKNMYGFNFEVVNDVSTTYEHEYVDISESCFEELKEKFPEHKWGFE